MKKYKVCVYAIAKNEEKFVKKWVESMSEADEIYVMLDATSSDATEQLLLDAGVHVTKKLIKPWRFDTARNESLKLVPQDADICVCTDLDEVFSKGWREILEKTWQPNTNQAIYRFYHNAGTPTAVPNIFDYGKIHDRKNFQWKWIIHEYIMPIDSNFTAKTVFLKDVMLYHYPDLQKKRSYKELLENAVKLDKEDIRYQQLLVEEYLNANELGKAEKWIKVMKSNEKEMKNDHNFCFAQKLACILERKKGNFKKVKKLCQEAIAKFSYCKWFYGELGDVQINCLQENEEGIKNLFKCKQIERDVITAREREWNDHSKIYNIISIGYFNLKDYTSAIAAVTKAIELTKNEECRQVYKQNERVYEDYLSDPQSLEDLLKFVNK